MAIIIPSKKIFNETNNIIKKNVINKCEINYTNVYADNQYNEVVNRTEIEENIDIKRNWEEPMWQIEDKPVQVLDGQNTKTTMFVAEIGTSQRYITKTIKIPKLLINHYITDIFSGINYSIDENGEKREDGTKINVFVHAIKRYSNNASCSLDAVFDSSARLDKEKSNNFPSHYNISEPEYYSEIPLKFTYKVSVSDDFGQTYGFNLETNLRDNSTIKSATFSEITESVNNKTIEYYQITLKVLSDTQVYKLNGYNTKNGTVESFANTNVYFNLTGIYEEYLSTKVDFTFYGNTIGINLQNETITIGDGKHVYAFDGNELYQFTNTYNDEKLIEKQAQNIINEYKYGKETASLLCSIGNYYDENNKIKISCEPQKAEVQCINKMIQELPFNLKLYNVYFLDSFYKYQNIKKIKIPSISNSYFIVQDYNISNNTFHITVSYKEYNNFIINNQYDSLYQERFMFDIGDVVIPHIRNVQGTDIPMSLKGDGSAKEFIIVGVRPYYDGAVWQELTLLEKTV